MEWAQQFVEQYGYWAVFIWTFIEGESVFIAAAALAAAGLLQPWKVIVVAACGAYIGHIVFFIIGRWKGMAVINAVPFLKRHYPKANMVLDRYAHWSIFIFQYLYGTRLVAAIMFGCSSIGFARFALLQIINCITWAIVIYAVGHALGMAGVAILHRFGIAGLVAVIVAALLLGGGIYLHYGHRLRKHLSNDDQQRGDE
jgi:membrane protein DedA with SNARE-associated domain